MKPFRSTCVLPIAITVAGLLHLVALANGASEFRRCYNVSEYTHCFDVQYNTIDNQTLTASFDDARQQCNNLQSTLIVIKDEETNEKLQEFMNEENNPIRSNDVWLDAYRFNDYNVTNRWKWLNKTLPNIPDLGVVNTADSKWYMAALEFNANSFRLTAQQPHLSNNYICDYPVSTCPSVDSSNVRQFDGMCYTVVNESVSWYEARNRCLKGGGDLASFANVTSINFTSWLVANSTVKYWIGLRFSGYIWKDTGEDVKFAKWINNDDWDSLCLSVCSRPNSDSSFSWCPKDCSITNSIHVVCHTATTLHLTTTLTITTPTALTSSGSEAPQSNNSSPQHESSESLAIGIGVGVGVGVPVLIAVIVLVICIVVRKRRHETLSSSQSTNRQHREAPTMKEREEVGETAYGTVVPSTFSRQAAQANGAHSATEQTVYAPLQIL